MHTYLVVAVLKSHNTHAFHLVLAANVRRAKAEANQHFALLGVVELVPSKSNVVYYKAMKLPAHCEIGENNKAFDLKIAEYFAAKKKFVG